jgi:hypothetical protein
MCTSEIILADKNSIIKPFLLFRRDVLLAWLPPSAASFYIVAKNGEKKKDERKCVADIFSQ